MGRPASGARLFDAAGTVDSDFIQDLCKKKKERGPVFKNPIDGSLIPNEDYLTRVSVRRKGELILRGVLEN